MSEAATQDKPVKAKVPLRERISHQALLLGGFSLVATLLLVLGNLATQEAIGERQREDLLDSLSQVIPQTLFDNDLLQDPLQLTDEQGQPLTVYRGILNARVRALAWEIAGPGYSGDIRLLMGVDAEGKVLGVRVLSHAETPGLGDLIDTARSDWILGFDGLSLVNTPLRDWFVKKDGGRFDSFSGATITPRGVVQAVREGLQYFDVHRSQLLALTAATPPATQPHTQE